MHINLKYWSDKIFQKVLSEQMMALGIDFTFSNGNAIIIKGSIGKDALEELNDRLEEYGIEVLHDPKDMLIQRIKDILTHLALNPQESGNQKISVYLTEHLPYSYSYISKLFSEGTHYSIEQFFILTKVEQAKKMIIEDQHSLTEIAFKLNYSSVAHLSKQFKRATGITPTAFYNFIKKREEILV